MSERFNSQQFKDQLSIDAVEKFRKAFTHVDAVLTGVQANFDPRRMALARTHIETAAMYATKSISHVEVD